MAEAVLETNDIRDLEPTFAIFRYFDRPNGIRTFFFEIKVILWCEQVPAHLVTFYRG